MPQHRRTAKTRRFVLCVLFLCIACGNESPSSMLAQDMFVDAGVLDMATEEPNLEVANRSELPLVLFADTQWIADLAPVSSTIYLFVLPARSGLVDLTVYESERVFNMRRPDSDPYLRWQVILSYDDAVYWEIPAL